MRIPFVLLFSLLLSVPPALAAPSVEARVTPNKGSSSDIFRINVDVSGASAADASAPRFETSDQFAIEATGASARHEFVNGTLTSGVSFSFTATPTSKIPPGTHSLPTGSVRVNGQTIRFKGPKLVITKQSKSTRGKARLSDVAFAQTVSNYEPYVGEQITYRAEIAANSRFEQGELQDFELKSFWRERVTTDKPVSRRLGTTIVHSFIEVLIPTAAGKLKIPVRKFNAKLNRLNSSSRRRRGFDPLFGNIFPRRQTTRLVTLSAEPIIVNAKPLPPPPVDDVPYIPVGTLSIKAVPDHNSVKLGESISYYVQFVGTGNLRPLALSDDGDSTNFKRYDEKPALKIKIVGDKLEFTKTFSMALIPQRTGKVYLPTFRVLYFDPSDASYKIAETPKQSVEVLPGKIEDKLIISRADRAPLPSDLVPDRKKEVSVISQDLLPQHVGSASLLAAPRLSNFLIALLVFLLPLGALPLRVFLSRRELLQRDPAEALRRLALKNALERLDSLPPEHTSAESVRSVFLRYVTERYTVSAESLTPQETETLLEMKKVPKKILTETGALLRSLEAILYSGENARLPDDVIRKTRQLLEELENAH